MDFMKNLIAILILFFFSCSAEKKSIAGKELFFDDNNSSDINLSYKKMIPLETSDSCLIGSINQVEILCDKIFVLDAFVSKKLYVFDIHGQFISTVGIRGQGPEEYLFPQSFSIHLKENTISIVDPQQNAFIQYDLNSFEFIEKKRVPFASNDIEFLEDGNYVSQINGQDMSGKNTFHFIISNSNFKEINHFINIDFSPGHLNPPYKNLYMMNGKVHGFIRFRNIIYEIHSDSIIPKYSLSFKKHSFPPLEQLRKERDAAFNKNHLPWLEQSGYIFYYNIIETETAMCIDYIANKERYFGFYNKENNKTYYYELKQFQELSNIYGIEQIAGKSSDNHFIAILRSQMIINQRNNNKSQDESEKIFENIHVDDNPILFLFKL
jgi:hypothetical protein